jgi:hypothetical protein
MPALLNQHGFSIRDIEAGYLAGFPQAPSFCWWGTAERIDSTPQR